MSVPAARWAAISDLQFLRTAGPSHYSERILRRKIEWNEAAVATMDGMLAGYMILDHIWSSLPFIATIFVLKELRHRGVARAMLEFIEGEARAGGEMSIYSSSQLDEPEPQAWHRHMGFEECGIWSGHNNGIGEVFFRKQL